MGHIARLFMGVYGILGKQEYLKKKGRNLASGVRFSESATSVFSPMGYRSKELWKKDGFSMKKKYGPRASNPREISRPRDFCSGSEKSSRDPIFGEICPGLNIEVLSLPEGLVHSIGILEAPGVFLARRWRRC